MDYFLRPLRHKIAAHVQASLRRRILHAFVGRGLLQSFEAKEMLAYAHSGFSVDAGVCIQAHDCAALERLRKAGSELVDHCAKQNSEPSSDKRGVKADELTLTPLELIDRPRASRCRPSAQRTTCGRFCSPASNTRTHRGRF